VLADVYVEAAVSSSPQTKVSAGVDKSLLAEGPSDQEDHQDFTAYRSPSVFVSSRVYENPIQRPPHPTVNHNASDVRPTTLYEVAENRPSSAKTTRRRTVNVNRMAARSAVIFVQNAKL
jgi:hypothetical protein